MSSSVPSTPASTGSGSNRRSILKKRTISDNSPAATGNLTSQSSTTFKRENTINHDINFQAVLPGYPPGYFMDILPSCPLGQIYPPDGYPGYDYTTVEDHTLNVPYRNSLFQPTSPHPTYVCSMPWCAFPYGIPARDKQQKEVSPESMDVSDEKGFATPDGRSAGSVEAVILPATEDKPLRVKMPAPLGFWHQD